MKKIVLISLFAVLLCANNYDSMSLEELQNQRASVTLENREAYQNVVKKRLEEMNDKKESSIQKTNNKKEEVLNNGR